MKKAKTVAHDIEDTAEDVTGGKIQFVKSMKNFGKDFGTAMKKAKVIAQEGVQFAKNIIGSSDGHDGCGNEKAKTHQNSERKRKASPCTCA